MKEFQIYEDLKSLSKKNMTEISGSFMQSHYTNGASSQLHLHLLPSYSDETECLNPI